MIWSPDRLAAAGIAAQIADEVESVSLCPPDRDPAEAAADRGIDLLVVDLGVDDVRRAILDDLAGGDMGPVVVLADDPPALDRSRAAWFAGGGGLLPRDADAESLVAAIRAAAAGLWVESLLPVRQEIFADGTVTTGGELSSADSVGRGNRVDVGPVVRRGQVGPPGGRPGDRDNAADSVDALTPREVEVLGEIARGLPNKAIAYELGISEHTVKFHVTGILGKLGAASRTEAVVAATRAGYLHL